jgi:hypothetical protein
MAQRVDLLLRALNQDEAAQLRGLRFEDGDVETLDLPILREARELAPCLVEQVEGLSFAPVCRNPHATQNPASAMALTFIRRFGR